MFFPTFSLGPVYEFVCISFRTDNLYCLGQFDHGGQDGNAAQSRIRDETSENGHTLKTKLSSWYYLPNHKSFGYSEVLVWFRDGTIRRVHQEV